MVEHYDGPLWLHSGACPDCESVWDGLGDKEGPPFKDIELVDQGPECPEDDCYPLDTETHGRVGGMTLEWECWQEEDD